MEINRNSLATQRQKISTKKIQTVHFMPERQDHSEGLFNGHPKNGIALNSLGDLLNEMMTDSADE